MKPTEITFPEREKHIGLRVRKLLRYIFSNYHDKNMNIIIVTHQSLCVEILKIVNLKSKEYKGKVNTEVIDNYEKGKVCLIYDGDWTFKLLN